MSNEGWTDFNTGQDYDPKMKEAMAEIKAIVKKYDCAAFVLLSSPIASEFMNEISPSWSVMRWEHRSEGSPTLRFRSKREDFASREQQNYCTDRTVNFLHRLRDMLGHHLLIMDSLLQQLVAAMDIRVTDPGRIKPHSEVEQ